MKGVPRRGPTLHQLYDLKEDILPRVDLIEEPSPVECHAGLCEALRAPHLYVKREDKLTRVMGGNKVRKLEFILADARREAADTLLTIGGIGSQHNAATAYYGRRLGFRSALSFFYHPYNLRLLKNVAVCQAYSDEMFYSRSFPEALLRLFLASHRVRRRRGRPYVIPPGGSSAVGTLGYVEAAFELKRQIEAGACPTPNFVCTAAGSAGTAAGLFLGLKLAGISSEVMAIPVVPSALCNEKSIRRLAKRTFRLLERASGRPIPEPDLSEGLHVFPYYLGKGYAFPLEGAARTIKLVYRHARLKLEPTYTGKAFYGMMDLMRLFGRSAVYLFVHTSHDDRYPFEVTEKHLRALPGPFRRLANRYLGV